MTRLTRKYEFANEEAAEAAIALLGVDIEGNPTHGHLVTKLGHLVLTPATFDSEHEQITAPVLSEKYAVDVYWSSEADVSWDSFIVWPIPFGIHSYGSSSSRDEYEATYCELHPNSLHCNPVAPE